MKLNKLLSALTLGATVALTSMSASAGNINVGGVVWNPDYVVDFKATAAMWEHTVSLPGDMASGYGNLLTWNNAAQNLYCPNCELTYTFGGFELVDPDPLALTFKDGWLKIWVQDKSSPTYTPFDPENAASATDGVLFLDLLAHTSTQNILTGFPPSLYKTAVGTLHGNITAGELGSGTETGKGAGMFDVIGGLAKGNFDTNFYDDNNAVGGKADFNFTSTFGPTYDGVPIPANPTLPLLTGSSNLFGKSIPEPGTMMLLGLGLLGVAASAKRRKA